MILEKLGKLSEAQSLTAGATASTNVVKIGALGIDEPGDVYLAVDTNVAAGGAGAITVDFVIATAADMTTGAVSVIRAYLAAVTDKRVLTAGKHIINCSLGDMVAQLARDLGATYLYIGLLYTLGGSATLTVNAALSTVKPPSDDNTQVTTSNVGVPTL